MLRATEGLNTKLLTKRYVDCHFKQIILKLSSMERAFPQASGKLLTSLSVLSQLRRRFEREILGAERPALRKVLNRDAHYANCMILSVASIGTSTPQNAPKAPPSSPNGHLLPTRRQPCVTVELTDGWYNVCATLDQGLSSRVVSGQVTIGTKLVTCASAMKGADDGVDPLDDGYSSKAGHGGEEPSARLMLQSNSTRRARWDAKLGWCGGWSRTGLLKVSLGTAAPGGGDVPLLEVVVYRRYPKMFAVTLNRPNKGMSTTTTLTTSEEEIAKEEWDRRDERLHEKIVENITEDPSHETEVDRSAPEIWKRMMSSSDTGEFYGRLTVDEQKECSNWKERRGVLLQDAHRRAIKDALEEKDDSEEVRVCESRSLPKIQIAKPKMNPNTIILCCSSQRISRPFAEFLVVQMERGKDGREPCPAILRISGGEEIDHYYESLREGVGLRLKNVMVKDKKKNGLVQLQKTRDTKIKILKLDAADLRDSYYSPRRYFSIEEVTDKAKLLMSSQPNPSTGLVDYTGTITKVMQEENHTQVFFTDASGLLVKLQRYYEYGDADSKRKQWRLFDAPAGTEWRLKDVLLESYDEDFGLTMCVWRPASVVEEVKGTKGALPGSAKGEISKVVKVS